MQAFDEKHWQIQKKGALMKTCDRELLKEKSVYKQQVDSLVYKIQNKSLAFILYLRKMPTDNLNGLGVVNR